MFNSSCVFFALRGKKRHTKKIKYHVPQAKVLIQKEKYYSAEG